MIQRDLTAKLDGYSWTVEFPVYIDCTYLNGRYDEHGVARHGYAADAPFIDTPRQARDHYAKRFGIEASYRLSEQSIATTTTQNPVIRFLYVVVSLLLQNVWRYLHWEYMASPAEAGVASGSGHSRSSSTWSDEQRGRPSRCVGPSPRTDHRTTGSSGNHRPEEPCSRVASPSRRRRNAADCDDSLSILP